MGAVRSFFSTNVGRVVAAGVILLGVAAVYLSIRGSFGQSAAARASSQRIYICSETKQPFEYTIKAGDVLPVRSPYSGKNTGYPGERCGWTKDGTVAATETIVLLNSHIGSSEPTFCPDCGRLVVGHNPPAAAGQKPPPTRETYRSSGR